MAGKPGKSGQHRKTGAPALPGAGRQPKQALLTPGTLVFISQVWPVSTAYPVGGYADMGRGIVATVERIKGGADRLVKIPQPDGSEIRIVIAPEERHAA